MIKINETEELNTEFSNIQIVSDESFLSDIEVEEKDLIANKEEAEVREYPLPEQSKEEAEEAKVFPSMMITRETTSAPTPTELLKEDEAKANFDKTTKVGYDFTGPTVKPLIEQLLSKKKSKGLKDRENSTTEVNDKTLKALMEAYVPEKPKELKKELEKEDVDFREHSIITSPSAAIGQSILSTAMTFPDFMSNMFTAILVPKHYQTTPGELAVGELSKENPDDKNEIKAANILKDSFGLRLEGIDIPQPKKEAFETKFLNTSIKRVKPETSIVRNITLNIRQDTDFYICEFLERASGFSRWRKAADKSAVELFPSLFPVSISTQVSGGGKASKGLYDLYVYHQVSLDRAQTIDTKHNYILYIFRDIKFLGRASALDFKSDAANAITASFKMTFRKIEQFSYIS